MGEVHVFLIQMLLTATLAGVFPISALAYLAYQRQYQLNELEDDFKLLFDQDGDDLKNLVERYDRGYTLLGFASHSVLPTVLTALGVALLFTTVQRSAAIPAIGGDRAALLRALQFGFIGAYLYSIQLIYRRYTTFDLQPSVYMSCTLTLIAGFAFNYTGFSVLSQGLQQNGGAVESSVFAVLAFCLGYFPLLGLRWFNQLTNAALGDDSSLTDSQPLSVIDGISQFHEARLRDEGIDNVQNLAAVKISELLANTRFNAQQLLEWIDQAVLHSYVDAADIETFRRGGVRKVSDFLEIWKPYHAQPVRNGADGLVLPAIDERFADARRTRALQLQSTPEYLDALYVAASTGPNMGYLQSYWKASKLAVQRRTASALEDQRQKNQPLVISTQQHLFLQIGRHDLYSGMRETLGEVARKLIQEPAAFAAKSGLPDDQPEMLAGLAWWLHWMSDRDEHDYREQAQLYYEKALPGLSDKAEFLYELAVFYARAAIFDSAGEHGQQAITLFKDAGDNCSALLTQIQLALAWKEAGGEDEGREWLEAAAALWQEWQSAVPAPEPGDRVDVFKSLREQFEAVYPDSDGKEPFTTVRGQLQSLLAAGYSTDAPYVDKSDSLLPA